MLILDPESLCLQSTETHALGEDEVDEDEGSVGVVHNLDGPTELKYC